MTHRPSKHEVDLLKLLARFKPIDDVENVLAWFKTRVPSVAPYAYLNTIYKPASPDIRLKTARELEFTQSLERFYERYNGACLFVDRLSIDGLVDLDAPYERVDRFRLQPFRIAEANAEFATDLSSRGLICIGSYGFDRSLVCVKKADESVVCFRGTNFNRVRCEWDSFNGWLSSEVLRLASMHDDSGVIQVDESLTPPEQSLH